MSRKNEEKSNFCLTLVLKCVKMPMCSLSDVNEALS